MKKISLWSIIILLCISIVLSFSLAGCKEEVAPAEEEEAEEAAPAEEEEAEEAAPAEEEEVTIEIAWWGETEATGLEPYMKETVALFEEEYPNIKVDSQLKVIEQIMTQFRAGVEAGVTPDIQFFFGGVWCLEHAWLGNVQPFSKFFTQEELDQIWPMSRLYTTFEDEVYGFPFYTIGMAGVYNKDLFKQAGLDPENPPLTWDEWMDACEKLNAIGIAPYGIGDKDGGSGGEMGSFFGTQEFDSILDVWELFVGDAKVSDPKYSIYWEKLEEMVKAGMFNEDLMSLEHYQGHELFLKEEAATTWTTQPELVRWSLEMGEDKVGVMMVPIYGTGKLADTIGAPCQVLGIPTLAKHPEEAALFLKFMLRPDRVKSMYDNSYGILPTSNFDPSWITAEVDKKMLDWMSNKQGVWWQYLWPGQYNNEAAKVNCSLIFNGEITAEEAIDNCQDVIDRWKVENPTLVENMKIWRDSIAESIGEE